MVENHGSIARVAKIFARVKGVAKWKSSRSPKLDDDDDDRTLFRILNYIESTRRRVANRFHGGTKISTSGDSFLAISSSAITSKQHARIYFCLLTLLMQRSRRQISFNYNRHCWLTVTLSMVSDCTV